MPSVRDDVPLTSLPDWLTQSQDAPLASSMTHWPEGPNDAPEPYSSPAMAPYREVLKGYYAGGVPGAMRGAGVEPPGWLDSLVSFLRSGPVNDAMSYGMPELGMANPTPRIVGDVAARIDARIAEGASRKAIREEFGIGNATLGRYLDKTGQKTAAAENPYRGILGDPSNDDVIKAGLAKGDSVVSIADRIGTSPNNIWDRISRLEAKGELNYERKKAPPLLDDPQNRADLIRLAKEGNSTSAIASYFWGGAGGKHPRRGEIGRFIRKLQDEGEPALQNYAPQGGAGITPAGRTPTLPQMRFMEGEGPESDSGMAEAAKAVIDYLRSRGLHAEADQLHYG